jgi:hypothetical protein
MGSNFTSCTKPNERRVIANERHYSAKNEGSYRIADQVGDAPDARLFGSGSFDCLKIEWQIVHMSIPVSIVKGRLG